MKKLLEVEKNLLLLRGKKVLITYLVVIARNPTIIMMKAVVVRPKIYL
jgi:hypothetical protein